MKKRKYTVGSVAGFTILSAIIATILSSILVITFISFQSSLLKAVVQIASVCIFLNMIYSHSWACGDHDVNSVQFGHMEKDPFKGLKIGLVAMIPYALSIVFLISGKLELIHVMVDGQPSPLDLGFVYRIFNIQYLYLINLLIDPEVGTEAASWLSIAGIWMLNLLIPLTTSVAYALGYRRISIMERLVFKNLPKTQKQKKNH